MSALRRGENGIVLRFYNITRLVTSATITSTMALSEAYRLDLNENILEGVPVEELQRVSLDVKPGQIITISFKFA